MKALRVASFQMESVPKDKAANFSVLEELARQAAAQGANVMVFPELCTTGYWHLLGMNESELRALAEPVPGGASSQRLLGLAREYRCTIGAGILEAADDGRLYNTYVVATADGRTHRHRKLHAFESDHISSGSEFTVFETPDGWKLGVLIS